MLPADPAFRVAASGENTPLSQLSQVVSHMFFRVKVIGLSDVFVSCVATSPVTDVGMPYHPPVTCMIAGPGLGVVPPQPASAATTAMQARTAALVVALPSKLHDTPAQNKN